MALGSVVARAVALRSRPTRVRPLRRWLPHRQQLELQVFRQSGYFRRATFYRLMGNFDLVRSIGELWHKLQLK